MTYYLDTSVIVAAITDEAASLGVQTWLEAQDVGQLVISDWVVTEVSSALALKLRTRALDLNHRAAALALFHGLLTDVLTVHPVHRGHFNLAASFADHYEIGLRAGDAVHLAVAADVGATLATLDHRLQTAGPALGVPILAL